MGNTPKEKENLQNKNIYVVSTLNYSGILKSPFEFYTSENQQVLKSLSLIFEELLKLSQSPSNYSRSKFKWEIGKIDQKLQQLRYTPIYMKNCGIIKSQIITQQSLFKIIWEQHFSQGVKKVSFQYNQTQKTNCLNFDLLCYKTILFYVYYLKDKQLNSFNIKNCSLTNIDKANIQPYEKFMEAFYSKSFLKEDIKIQKTITAIQNHQIDIMFVQEASQAFIKRLQKMQIYKVIKKDKVDSIIIIRNGRFSIQDNNKKFNALSEQLKKQLNWNNDTVVGFIQNAVLISGHLSSKKDKNSQQIKQMISSIKKLKIIFPNKHIIVGCDANTRIQSSQHEINIFPKNDIDITTFKKRTMLQPQISKAEQLVKQSKDYLISNLNLIQPRITCIQFQISKLVNYIPCQKHPYDHFLVKAQIKIEKKL